MQPESRIVPAMLPRFLVRAFFTIALAALLSGVSAGADGLLGIDDPLHGYWTDTPQDRFTKLASELSTGAKHLDTSGDLPFLRSLLQELQIPVNSQMLVYSVTSLQKNLISPRRPRALYFNDDTYVGFIPGGRIEVVSIDPNLGGIFYIFERVRPGVQPKPNRSEDCMTCHATRHMQEVPGLVIESVVPGITGGGEKAFRRERTGHDIPFMDRFGGWHLTGAAGFPQKWGNILLEYTPEGRQERTILPGELFDISRYPVGTSDLLAQLLHEHQVGFVNRALQAMYRTRVLIKENGGEAPAESPELDTMARSLVRYLLFADEVPLPSDGVIGDAGFKSAFTSAGLKGSGEASLRDLDLTTRLMKYRCSYMIYSPAFAGLQPCLKSRIFALLSRVLMDGSSEPEFGYLALEEKRVIRETLTETMPETATYWRASAKLTVDSDAAASVNSENLE